MKLPPWLIALIIIAFIALGFYIYRLKQPVEVTKAKAALEVTDRKIDSATAKRDTARTDAVNRSGIRAAKARQITNSLEHETIQIPDTTYDYMREYILGVRPE
jgi:hypothetical protein